MKIIDTMNKFVYEVPDDMLLCDLYKYIRDSFPDAKLKWSYDKDV